MISRMIGGALLALGLLLLAGTEALAGVKLIELNGSSRSGRIAVPVGQSQTIRLSGSFGEVTIGNPETADLIPMTDSSMYVLGRSPGTTNISVYSPAKELIGVIDVEVTYDVAALSAALASAVPGGKVRCRSINGRILLEGSVPDASALARVLEIAGNFAGEAGVTNALTVASAQQVMLEVRMLEVERTAGRELGINLLATKNGVYKASTGAGSVFTANGQTVAAFNDKVESGATSFGTFVGELLSVGKVDVDMIIKALEDKGLGRRLAEPNLVALSGDSAQFLAGGEVPLPVPGNLNDTPSIEYKPFGVELLFTPTVLSDGLVNLKIQPSVSEVDYGNVAKVGNVAYPLFTRRSASTTVELRDGQSFAVAGLLQSYDTKSLQQVPWLGSVPVLGTLFRSASFQKKESELVIIVTPRLVRPMAPGDAVASPLDKRKPTNDPQFFTTGETELSAGMQDYFDNGGRQTQPYGHILTVQRKKPHAVYKQ